LTQAYNETKREVQHILKHTLIHDTLSIAIDLEIFEKDITYQTNTIMNICVESCGFCGKAIMDIDVKEFAKFSVQLSEIYTTLTGKAKIQEPFGQKQFLEFTGDGMGHIAVCGFICGESCFCQKLHFENMIDQTNSKDFAKELKDTYSVYLE